MERRRTRDEISSANREAVLRAARSAFERSGFHAATVAGIAADAGFSEGVVYSQFGSKVDLFLAVLEASIDARAKALAAAVEGPDGRPGPAEVRRVALAQSQLTLAWQATVLEFRVHAWRDPEVNARYQALHRRTIDNVAALVPALTPATGSDAGNDADPRRIAVGLLAATSGVTIELLADPDLDVETILADLAPVVGPHAQEGPR